MDGLFDSLVLGLAVALMPSNLLACLLGVALGTLFGVIPGIGPLVAMSLLFPFTFYMEPTAAIIMLAGIFYGTSYGGSISSILVNLPGTPANAVACLDGYPMAQKGRAGAALGMTTLASLIGGSVGILLMMLLSPALAAWALQFGPWEYFAIVLFGLVVGATITSGAPIKGFAMAVLGVILGVVGTDVASGLPRFTFGSMHLIDGLSLTALAMGLFGLAELLERVKRMPDAEVRVRKVSLRELLPTRDELGRSWMPMIRGSGLGSVVGVLPGTGALIASFMAYAVERKVAAEPSRFGKGAIEGVTAPEAANNAADQTAFIPTLTLGVPGSAAMAIILGVLMIHGITPGPLMLERQPDVFWGLVMSFWIGNILLVVLNVPLIGLWVKLLSIPFGLLYPMIIVLICMGAYATTLGSVEVIVVLCFGLLGLGLRWLGFPTAPVILGFVLGPLMEVNFARAMRISGGDFTSFLTRPISGLVLGLLALLIAYACYRMIAVRLRDRRRARTAATLRSATAGTTGSATIRGKSDDN